MSHIPLGTNSPDFHLKATDNDFYNLSSFSDKKILVVMFTCNHCPFVKAYEARLIKIQEAYLDRSVSLVAINSNETINYPEDTFENDQHKDLKADYIMANPPFNLKGWRAESELLDDPRWMGYDVPPKSNANYAWILNIVSKLFY